MNDSSNEPLGYNRRDFLKSGSFASLMTMMGGVELFAQSAPPAPTDDKTALLKIKVGVIGLGARGREILEAFGKSKHAEVAAICDTYGPFLRRSAKFAPAAKQLQDYKAMLEDKEVKAVVVATPTHKHKEIVLAALRAGKHVYCEAPIANSIEDGREIALAAKAAKKQIFQAGLQLRSDPQRLFLHPFLRTGALGTWIMCRSQWHRKQSWRTTSPDAEQEKALNWRLSRATSTGLVGELGIHEIDQAAWFLNAPPVSVTGFSSLLKWTDGRDVPDTAQAVFEFPHGVRLMWDATIANSFDADYEIYYGSDAAVMMRENRAWMFKEVDSPLLSWEVYAKKERFFKEAGIVLMIGGSKQATMEKAEAEVPFGTATLTSALESFLLNSADLTAAAQQFIADYGEDDQEGLMTTLAKVREGQASQRPAAGYLEGFRALVTAIKANEVILSGSKVVFQPEWYELG